MRHDEYEKIKAVNWSTLKLVNTSPLLARYRQDQPQEDTAAYRLGRAVHCLVLEPGEFSKRYAVYHDSATRRGKAWDAWCEANPGLEALTPSEGDAVANAARATREHREAAKLLDAGRAEVLVQWTDETHGVECKGRLDYLRSNRVVDLKTTSKQSLREIVQQFWSLCYHGQLAWYHDGAISAGLLPPDAALPAVVFVQTVEPYDCVVAELSADGLTLGRNLYQSLLTTLCECSAAGMYPGMAPDLISLVPPTWAVADVDRVGGEW